VTDFVLREGSAFLSRLTPGLAGTYWLDFPSPDPEGEEGPQAPRRIPLRYPDHEPFVGRVQELRSLLTLPSLYDDRPLQRVVWVHGDPAMGKSALVRQFAMYVRDIAFHDAGDPVYLLHLYCHGITKPEAVVAKVCDIAPKVYPIPETPESVEELCELLGDLGGTHVWVLDDLTYLSVWPDSIGEAAGLAARIREAARINALPLELVVSHRRPGPKTVERILVKPLAIPEALELAQRIFAERGKEFTPSDMFGAARMLRLFGGNPAPYKRAAFLAADRGISFNQYVDELERTGGLEQAESAEQALAMVQYEVDQLKLLEATHGFAYSRFLGSYYPLVARASYFTLAELVTWFGEGFKFPGDQRPPETVYQNGLEYLARLNYVLTEKRDGNVAFAMPPNQRVIMEARADRLATLPPPVPLRGASERLSLALERAKTGHVDAVGDLLLMEGDYRPHMSEAEAATAVFYSMLVRAEIAAHALSDGPVAAIRLYDEIAQLYDGHSRYFAARDESPAAATAKALVNKGVTLGQLGRPEAALALWERLVEVYGSSQEPVLQEQVAEALFSEAVVLVELGRSELAIAAYARALVIRPAWGMAYRNLANLLTSAGRLEEAETACGAAERLEPDHPYTAGRRAKLESAKGNHQEALMEFRRAAILSEDETEFNFEMALAMLPLGLTEEALTAIRDRLSRHKAPPDLQSALRDFSRLKATAQAVPGLEGAIALLEARANERST